MAVPSFHRALVALVPDYRLSKFQRVLPDKWQVEMGGHLLDFERAGQAVAS